MKPWERYDSFSEYEEDNPDAVWMTSLHYGDDPYWCHNIDFPLPDSTRLEPSFQSNILVYVIPGVIFGSDAPNPVIIGHTSGGFAEIRKFIEDNVHDTEVLEWQRLYVFEEIEANSMTPGIAEYIENYLWEKIDPKYHTYRHSGPHKASLSESEIAIAEDYAQSARSHLDTYRVDAFCEYRKKEMEELEARLKNPI